MANHGAAAALLVASLLVSAVALAGARRPLSARIAVNRDAASRAHVVKKQQEDAAPAAVPSLSCSEVHGVQEGETCFSVAQGAGLTKDDFLGFNPNINCEEVFVGQWLCLAATSA